MIPLIDLQSLIVLSFIACGISYVITGSKIGYFVRWIWWHMTHRIHLDSLAFCPSCNAWWVGFSISLLHSANLVLAAQCAFSSCLLAAVVEAAFGLAAQDRNIISGEESKIG